MYRKIAVAAAATLFMAAGAFAQEIGGNYKSSATGETVKIAPCGAGYCLTYTTGPFSGKQIGSFKETSKGKYTGTVTKYEKDGSSKQYKGKGQMSGKNFVASGCVAGGLICQKVTYTKL